MNLMEVIQEERSKSMCNKVVAYVGSKSDRFGRLVRLVLKGEERLAQRASWSMTCCVEAHPELLAPHLQEVVKSLKKPKQHEAVKRGIVRALQFVSIPRKLQGEVADTCFALVRDTRQAIAVRAFSMTVLYNLTMENPELGQELSLVLEDQMAFGSAGIRSRAWKIISQLNVSGHGQRNH